MTPCARAIAALACAVLAILTSAAGLAAARQAAVAIDVRTSEILFDMNGNDRAYPASLAKLMTLYLTFEAIEDGRLTLTQSIAASARAAAQPATRLGLRAGDELTIEEAILGLVVVSANDAAVALAEAIADGERAFAERMTERARMLGMSRTRFRNATGLPDPAQTTTARDMALLGRALARQFPAFYGYFARTGFSWRGMTLLTHNPILRRYPGADGLKTGYIRKAGYNLAASARRSDRHVIAVLLAAPDPGARDRQMHRLLDRAFARAASRTAADGRTYAGVPLPRSRPLLAETAREAALGREGRSRPGFAPSLPVRPAIDGGRQAGDGPARCTALVLLFTACASQGATDAPISIP